MSVMNNHLSQPKVLIDASNLHGGGGVQVAASFLDELADCRASSETTLRYPWLHRLDVELSSAVQQNVEPGTVMAVAGSVVNRRPRHIAKRRSHDYDATFVVFGPEYGRRRGSTRMVGFADSTVLVSRPQGVPKPPLVRRAMNALRSHVSRALLKSADVLVVETERTALDTARCLGLEIARVRVVTNTVNAVFDDPDKWGPPLPRPDVPEDAYLLAYVSRAYPHKNFDLLGTVGDIAQSAFGVTLVFLVTLNDQEWGALTPQTRGHSVNLGPVPVTQVPEVYRMADAAVFPSLLESFSAMPVEAMRMGRVVFASDRDFVRTSCADAPIYVEPLDPMSTASTIARALPDADLMRRHRERGARVVESLPSARDRALAYLALIDEMLDRQLQTSGNLRAERRG